MLLFGVEAKLLSQITGTLLYLFPDLGASLLSLPRSVSVAQLQGLILCLLQGVCGRLDTQTSLSLFVFAVGLCLVLLQGRLLPLLEETVYKLLLGIDLDGQCVLLALELLQFLVHGVVTPHQLDGEGSIWQLTVGLGVSAGPVLLVGLYLVHDEHYPQAIAPPQRLHPYQASRLAHPQLMLLFLDLLPVLHLFEPGLDTVPVHLKGQPVQGGCCLKNSAIHGCFCGSRQLSLGIESRIRLVCRWATFLTEVVERRLRAQIAIWGV